MEWDMRIETGTRDKVREEFFEMIGKRADAIKNCKPTGLYEHMGKLKNEIYFLIEVMDKLELFNGNVERVSYLTIVINI